MTHSSVKTHERGLWEFQRTDKPFGLDTETLGQGWEQGEANAFGKFKEASFSELCKCRAGTWE